MGWPQYLYLGLVGLHVAVHLALHGRPREDHYDGKTTILSAVFIVWLLWMGGFWS